MSTVVSYVGNFSVCGVDRTIEILEADMDILKNTHEGLLWPKYLPKLDGAMIWCVAGLSVVKSFTGPRLAPRPRSCACPSLVLPDTAFFLDSAISREIRGRWKT